MSHASLRARSSVELVTPAQATVWLEQLYNGQRSLIRSKVIEYEQAMRDGKFVDGSPITLDVNGKLIDGQHRLNAVVNTGMPQVFAVIQGVPTEAYATIDQGAKRSAGDILRFHGLSSHGMKAAIAGGYIRAITGGRNAMTVAEYAKDNDDVLSEAVAVVEAFKARKWLVTQAAVGAAALHLLLHGCSVDLVSEFLWEAADGAGVGDSSSLLLRDALMSGVCSGVGGFWIDGKGRKVTNTIALTTYLWERWIRGKGTRRAVVAKNGKSLKVAKPSQMGCAA